MLFCIARMESRDFPAYARRRHSDGSTMRMPRFWPAHHRMYPLLSNVAPPYGPAKDIGPL